MRKLPKAEWSHAHHLFIFFGRYFCKAKNPQCPDCPFTSFCREYKAQQKQAEAGCQESGPGQSQSLNSTAK